MMLVDFRATPGGTRSSSPAPPWRFSPLRWTSSKGGATTAVSGRRATTAGARRALTSDKFVALKRMGNSAVSSDPDRRRLSRGPAPGGFGGREVALGPQPILEVGTMLKAALAGLAERPG